MTDVKTYLDPAEEKMEMAVAYLDEALAHIRAGKANPKILDGIRVEYYGSAAPISNVANVSVPDARTITITPWEKSMFKEIEKAIINSELGITPENNGEVIRISIPPLTEERRKALVKQSKSEAENAKVSVRNARRDAIDWPPVIHAQPVVSGVVESIPASRRDLAFIHLEENTINSRMEKASRYAEKEVERRGKHRYSAAAYAVKPLGRFVRSYFLKGGWRDGRPGLLWALLEAHYKLATLLRQHPDGQ